MRFYRAGAKGYRGGDAIPTLDPSTVGATQCALCRLNPCRLWPLPALAAGLLALTVLGCTPRPELDPHEQLPAAATDTEAIAGTQLNDWCTGYQPPALQALTDRALSDNRDLAAVAARLQEAQANARAAGAARWPALSLEGSASRARQPFIGEVPPELPFDLETTRTRLQLGAAAQYEIDLWNRLGDQAKAAALQAEAGAEDLRAARVTLAAQVADGWFELIARRRQAALLAEQVQSAERLLELTRLRFARGQAQGLDIVQQRQQTETLRGQLSIARAQAAVAQSQLSVLLGAAPGDAFATDPTLPQPAPLPLSGIPANLLELRPDLAAAAARVRAADRQAAAAVAERLPGIQLTARAFGEAAGPGELFDRIFWNLAGNVSLLLFDSGRLAALVQAADARTEAALQEYAGAYLTALAEVGQALLLEDGQREQLHSLQAQQQAAERALQLAREGYLAGALDYLRVLNAQQSLHQSSQALLDGERQLLSHRLQLCRALGHAPPVGA